MADVALILLAALVLDALVGDPDWLWRRLPHPITLIGRLIGHIDHQFNLPNAAFGTRRRLGVMVILLLLAAAAVCGMALAFLFKILPFGWIPETLLVAVFLAQRSLCQHVLSVAKGFRDDGLSGARQAVGMIVGRDPEQLDEAGVCRAAIESLAENFSDGVMAPAFWYLLAGLPGLLAYKLLNTADSMIGHRNERHAAFGWATARLDDLANLPAARLSALLILLASAPPSWHGILRSLWHDAPKHRSPNAGWPEAAMGASLGLALAGPRSYGSEQVEDAWMNATGRQAANSQDIQRAVALCWRSFFMLLLALALIAAGALLA
ncbi:adenosylcobinamide-phosphate synthase CbiB [Fodinicurvata fenggangensis]|uniref:adenosylcobinamide-phosphate synthase CbiB n=1 Tax=Fodinicurvata fenggangensis TaxID=1121830 RepID=UPI00047BAFB6|nr:adenosylcobinamide-phosphate synthase CbiB [Fodinicurvata fenggangensis]